jgi:hypothetical protein
MRLYDTTTAIELDKDGKVVFMKGKCKAKDLQKKLNLSQELGLDWVYC